MIPILYPKDETEFKSNGLGRLSDAISCTVTEERNSIYELEMVYPVWGIHYTEIEETCFIKATPSEDANDQPFYIYKVTKPLSGQVTVYAQHLSYALNKKTVLAFSASSASAAMTSLKSNVVNGTKFTFWTDVTTNGTLSFNIPKTVRSCLGGDEDSILDVFGGDYEWDMYEVKLHANRGSSNGVTIRYGKNLTDLSAETDMSNVYTSAVPYYSSGDTVVVGSATYSEHVSAYVDELMVPLDLTSEFDSTPTASALNARAQTYMSQNSTWDPTESITVSFVNLWETEEYKDIALLEKVKLCDYVTVIHEKLGIQVTMRVITTVYNVLLDRYSEITLGDSTDSVSSVISGIETSMKSDIANVTNQVAAAIANLDAQLDEEYVKHSEIEVITEEEINALFEE